MRGGWPGVIALVAATAVAIAQSRPANACSCGYQLDTFPRDGEVDVPPNAIPRVYSSIDDPFLFNEYRLYVQGQERPVDVELELTERPFARESILWLRPIYGLIADTTYEIRSREIQDRSAEELIVSMFTTGDDLDVEAPDYAGIVAFTPEAWRVETSGVSNSCLSTGVHSLVRIDYGERPQGLAYLRVDIRAEADDGWSDDWTLRMRLESAPNPDILFMRPIGGNECTVPPPPIEAGHRYCARVSAVDLAGNESGGDKELCAPAVSCSVGSGGDTLPDECTATGCSAAAARHSIATFAIAGLALGFVARRRRRATA